LGFGYIEENIKLLGPNENDRSTTNIYGTAYEISEHSRKIIAWRLGQFLGPPGTGTAVGLLPIALFNGKCAQLFDEHWFGISLGI
jgi:hypothetical protein